MASKNTFRMAPPQQVYDAYKSIRDSDLILNKTIDEKNIADFQTSLNASQPTNETEAQTRSLIQYLYRKNPTNFCRFLVRSRLSHLILWTEAKCIVRHFNLRGIVYVKWNDSEYECSAHRNINEDGNSSQTPVQRTYKSNDNDTIDNIRRSSRYQRDDERSRHVEGRERSGGRGRGKGRGENRYDTQSERGNNWNREPSREKHHDGNKKVNTTPHREFPINPDVSDSSEHEHAADMTASVSYSNVLTRSTSIVEPAV